MSANYQTVPWFNTKEWNEVFEMIFSPNSSEADKHNALNILLIWKARCPSLPSGIESTLSLLEVKLGEPLRSEYVANDQVYRLAYSTAIMRFVNHILDLETAKGSSLYRAATNLDIPHWIIDLRHDTAHNNNLPTLELLTEAADICLEWLKINYWDKYRQTIKDFVSGQQIIVTENRNSGKILQVLNLYVGLSICSHINCKIKNIADISDGKLKQSILDDARDILGDCIDFSNLKKVSIRSIINLLNDSSKKLMANPDAAKYVTAALLGDDSVILSLELYNFWNGKKMNVKEKLSLEYIQYFEVLLKFLQIHNILEDFIIDLIKFTQNYDDNNNKKYVLASLWISEILKALKKCQNFSDRANSKGISAEDLRKKNQKDLKSLFHHWFPNVPSSSVFLNLTKPIPNNLKDINIIRPLITEYNPYLSYFMEDLLVLIEPPLPRSTINKICMLAKSLRTPHLFPNPPNEIYTADDLMKGISMNHKKSIDDNDSDSIIFEEITEDKPVDSYYGIWKLVSRSDWAACPIGILPWKPIPNNLEMES